MASEDPPRRLSRSESKAQTRRLLLEAAARVIATHGYQAATVEMIAAEAGFSVGALYSNFRGKEDLFVALGVEIATERLDKLVEKMSGPGVDPFDALGRELTELADSGDSALLEAELWLFAARNPHRRDELLAPFRTNRDRWTALLWARRAMTGDTSDVDPADLVTIAIALGRGLTIQRRIDRDSVSPEIYGKALRWVFEGASRE